MHRGDLDLWITGIRRPLLFLGHRLIERIVAIHRRLGAEITDIADLANLYPGQCRIGGLD